LNIVALIPLDKFPDRSIIVTEFERVGSASRVVPK
jgi:hypothetical protein